ncbi:MAG: tetratricopeptide repeat protein [Phycisphaerae bacterium]
MASEHHTTMAQGGQNHLIDAAWNQVAGIARSSTTGSFAPQAATRPPPLPPDAFPGYRIIEEIHRGGQGVVYKATQASTDRFVAIKVLRDTHLLGESDVMRFEQEVRILGRLRHPNVVRIYDSLVAGDRFYYVMDYIPGAALDAYVRQSRPAVDDVVRLFVRICDAVNAAHLHGIIHRDLKPGNIRVDPNGVPYVLDFGLSKLTDGKDTSVTMTGQFVGSAPWASPEQACGDIDQIDLRTDVYSLGVLLYQMVTGCFPYSVQGSPSDVLTRILEAEPAPPRRHNRSIASDLETIILKCLQKESDRRYQSAGDLGRDLERYLNHEPIEARRDSFSYILVKQLARYKFVAMSAAAFVILLVVGLVVSVTLWQQASRALMDAETQTHIAQQQEARAIEQAGKANVAREESEAVTKFLSALMGMGNPAAGGSRDMLVLEALDTAREKLGAGEAPKQPQVAAMLHDILGMSFAGLGELDTGFELIDCAVNTFRDNGLGDHPNLRLALLHRAELHRALSRSVDAESDVRDALELFEKCGEPEPGMRLSSLNALAGIYHDRGARAEAEVLFLQVLEGRTRLLGDGHPEVARTLNDYALLLSSTNRRKDALEWMRCALEMDIARPHSNRASRAGFIGNLATMLANEGQFAEAEVMHREAVRELQRVHKRGHPTTITHLGNLATMLRLQQRRGEAEAIYRETIAMCREVLPPNSHTLGAHLHNYAIVLIDQGRHEEAEVALRDSARVFAAAYSPDHEDVLKSRAIIPAIMRMRGDVAQAEAELREIVDLALRRRMGDDELIVNWRGNIGQLMFEQGDKPGAEAIFRETLDQQLASGRSYDHPEVLISRDRVADCLQARGEVDEGARMRRETLEAYRALGRTENVILCLNQLSTMARDVGEIVAAEQYSCEAVQLAERHMSPRKAEYWLIRGNWAIALSSLGRFEEGLALMRESRDTVVRMHGESHPHAIRLNTQLEKLEQAAADARHGDAPPQ